MSTSSPIPSPTEPEASPSQPTSAAAPLQPRPSLTELFVAFATISLSGFGGVLAWSRRMMVEERKWLTPEQFNETYALCAFLPGGNILNFSVIFGSRFRGALGAIAAAAGLMGPPLLLVLCIGAIYAHYGDVPALRHMLSGVASAAAGLMMATVAKMARPLFRSRAVTGPLIALATFASIGVLQWPLPLVLVVIVPASIAAAIMGAVMNAGGGTLLTLAGYFALLSLFAIGGGNSAVPEMHRFAVDVEHWLSNQQFADSFALAQLTPGPNIIIVTLIGYHVAGIPGALVTTLAMCGPSARVCFFCRRRIRPLQRRGVACRAEPRLGSGHHRPDRSKRHRRRQQRQATAGGRRRLRSAPR